MTLIIGVKCSDGIVVGGDSIITYGSPETYSAIEQEISSKITIEANDVIVAYSGAVGMRRQDNCGPRLNPRFDVLMQWLNS